VGRTHLPLSRRDKAPMWRHRPVHATLHPASASEPAADELIPGARIVADAYHQATGRPITLDALADRLRIHVHVAERLLAALPATEPHHTTSGRLDGTTAVEALA
jgi:hypothetical protein